MFEINDTVLYGAEGVCRITEIVSKNFGGEAREYYELKPIHKEHSTIFVPLRNERLLAKMKRLLSAEEIYEIIRTMNDGEVLWIEDEAQRKLAFRDILIRGNRREMMRLLRALYLQKQERIKKGRQLYQSDERIFKETEQLLYDEFALVLDIQPEQVTPFILNQIQPGKAKTKGEPDVL